MNKQTSTLSKDDAEDLEDLATSLTEKNRWADALEVWSKIPSLKLGRGAARAYIGYIRCLRQLGRLNDAVKILKIAEKRHGETPGLVRESVHLALRRGDTKLALNRLELFRELSPLVQHEFYFARRSEILLTLGRNDDALATATEGLAFFGSSQALTKVTALLTETVERQTEAALRLIKEQKWEDGLKVLRQLPGLSDGQLTPRVAEAYLRALHKTGLLDDAESFIGIATPKIRSHPSIIRLAADVAADRGDPHLALARWRLYRKAVPEDRASVAFQSEIALLLSIGQVEDARATALAAIDAFPDNSKFAELANSISAEQQNDIRENNLLSSSFDELNPNISHLFTDTVTSVAKQTKYGLAIKIASPSDSTQSHSQYIPELLGASEVVGPISKSMNMDDFDVFAVWGATKAAAHNLARHYAASLDKPLLALEYGFISSPGIAINNVPQCSIIVCPNSIYYDATMPNGIEHFLNSHSFEIPIEQRERVDDLIQFILYNKITKYNHAPIIDMESVLPRNGRPSILLVDQRFGDQSIEKGLGSIQAFRRMLDAAFRHDDHNIIIKIHPDAISGGQGSYLGRLLDEYRSDRIFIVDYEVNPFSLFDVVDRVFVCTSQLGFEALIAGKEVTCFGAPFYAGWGLTEDTIAVPRRRAVRSLQEMFYAYYIKYSRYYVPGKGVADLEDLCRYIVAWRSTSKVATPLQPVGQPMPAPPVEIRVAFVIPSGRFGASGRYMQTLAVAMRRLGAKVMILAEGRTKLVENGISWRSISFKGMGLESDLMADILDFAPNVVYLNGVRTRAQRAAVEIILRTGARLAMQSEDDDLDVYSHHRPTSDLAKVTFLDRPKLELSDVATFLASNDWDHTLRVLMDPSHDRWVEPFLRSLCYHLAELHTAIWVPFAERLQREYGCATTIVPPVASWQDFEQRLFTAAERERVLQRYGLDPESTVFYISGSLYPYSNEFEVFIEALNRLSQLKPERRISLVVTGRTTLDVSAIAEEMLSPSIAFIDLENPPDAYYMEMLRAADVSCSPGLPSSFNELRLPSRLVKSMAMGQPVVTCEAGFGKSLCHGENAVILRDADPACWAEAMSLLLEPDQRASIGAGGRDFALKHFHPDPVAERLVSAMQSLVSDRFGQSHFRSVAPASSGMDAAVRDPTTKLYTSLSLLGRRGQPVLQNVVHIGAGMASEVPDFCRLGAKRIVLIEPNPAHAARLQQLLANPGKIDVYQAALADIDGSAPFLHWFNARTGRSADLRGHLSAAGGVASSLPNLELDRETIVPTVSLPSLVQNLALDTAPNLLILDLPLIDKALGHSLVSTSALKEFGAVIINVDLRAQAEDIVAKYLIDGGYSVFAADSSNGKREAQYLFYRSDIFGLIETAG